MDFQELLYGNTRTYLIKGKAKYLLFDTDWAGTLPAFFKGIKALGVTVSDISHLIISHYHPDHMGIAQDLVDLGIRLVVLDKQKDYLHQSDAIFEKEKNQTFKPIVDEQTLVISIRNSRDFLAGLGIDGEILWTPGHTKDSISLVLDSGHAFVGDLYPLDQVPLFKDATIIKSWDILLSKGIKEVHYAHPLPTSL